MKINKSKQFKAGFEEGYGKPLPQRWIFLAIVKLTFLASLLNELIAAFK